MFCVKTKTSKNNVTSGNVTIVTAFAEAGTR